MSGDDVSAENSALANLMQKLARSEQILWLQRSAARSSKKVAKRYDKIVLDCGKESAEAVCRQQLEQLFEIANGKANRLLAQHRRCDLPLVVLSREPRERN